MMRVITGKARGIHLLSPEGIETRPTTERTKEAVFSMMQFEIEGRNVLDLFAGSGQMGLEALSRGAKHATFADRSKVAVEIIKKNTLKTKLALDCDVICADYTEFLRSMRGRRKFDLVFMDPPYAIGAVPEVLKLLIRYDLLLPSSILVCETGDAMDVFAGDAALEAAFRVRRQTHYGICWVTMLEWSGEEQ